MTRLRVPAIRIEPTRWELAEAPPGAVGVSDIAALAFRPLTGAHPVAAALRDEGVDLLRAPRNLDGSDWWYRARIPTAPAGRGRLHLDGLATLADVWLNGEHLLRSENMFRAHQVALDGRLRGEDELLLRFAALEPALALKRPRPRWKTRLVRQQQLRWVRTSLIGRMPGWCPPVPPVGPIRAPVVEVAPIAAGDFGLRTSIEGSRGVVEVSLSLDRLPQAARLVVGEAEAPLAITASQDGARLSGTAIVPQVARWWPHTHGAQPRYPLRILVQAEGQEHSLEADPIGFRSLRLDTSGGGFALEVNEVPIFCRGAAWTPLDLHRLDAEPAAYRAALQALRRAGMNMLRLSGALAYEHDSFHALCDELGILVWQDFMFSSMDYPAEDPAFLAEARAEAEDRCARLSGRPSTAVLCGNNEVGQQAAMLGLPPERWSNPLFDEVLPRVCAERLPGAPYWPSTPWGGALPFQPDQGVSHYYGVGAFLRELDDARRAQVRFAAECLAFSNVPDEENLALVLADGQAPGTHPAWKARVPRDGGVAWDFEDVRDHYLERLFGVDPARLRFSDPQRWLALGRVTSGEVMARAFAEWRRAGSSCAGALVWQLRDLWPGAGWGVIDSGGRPKAAFRYLSRALQPVAVSITDEGLNGLCLHVINERAEPLEAVLGLTLYREGSVTVAAGERRVSLPPHQLLACPAQALLERFCDAGYAFRFGPPGHDLVVAHLCDPSGARIGEAFHFPLGLPAARVTAVPIVAAATATAEGDYLLSLEASSFAQSVAIEAPGFDADDEHFHLAPGVRRVVHLRRRAGHAAPLRASVQPLNAHTPVRVELRP